MDWRRPFYAIDKMHSEMFRILLDLFEIGKEQNKICFLLIDNIMKWQFFIGNINNVCQSAACRLHLHLLNN